MKGLLSRESFCNIDAERMRSRQSANKVQIFGIKTSNNSLSTPDTNQLVTNAYAIGTCRLIII